MSPLDTLHRRYDGPIPEWERQALADPLTIARGRAVCWEHKAASARAALARGSVWAADDLRVAEENLRRAEVFIREIERAARAAAA